MAASLVGLAEHGGEGQGENLVAHVAGDVHDPAAPVFGTGLHDQRAYHAGRVIMRLDEIADLDAVAVDLRPPSRIRTMEVDLGHVRLLRYKRSTCTRVTMSGAAEYSDDPGKGYYGGNLRGRRSCPMRPS